MRISDWSSDVCSSDLPRCRNRRRMISDATLRGYAATTYGVTRPDGTLLGLRLGSHSPEADRLLQQLGAVSLCCLNAWNPLSRRLPAARHMATHRRRKRAPTRKTRGRERGG